MKRLYFFLVLLICVFLAGCVTAKKVTKPRVDQELRGNVGYIHGRPHKPDEATESSVLKEREYIEVDVEVPIPSFPKYKEHYWEDDKVWGNKGYVSDDTNDTIK